MQLITCYSRSYLLNQRISALEEWSLNCRAATLGFKLIRYTGARAGLTCLDTSTKQNIKFNCFSDLDFHSEGEVGVYKSIVTRELCTKWLRLTLFTRLRKRELHAGSNCLPILRGESVALYSSYNVLDENIRRNLLNNYPRHKSFSLAVEVC